MSYLSMSLHVSCIWIIAMYTQSLKRSGFGELPEREHFCSSTGSRHCSFFSSWKNCILLHWILKTLIYCNLWNICRYLKYCVLCHWFSCSICCLFDLLLEVAIHLLLNILSQFLQTAESWHGYPWENYMGQEAGECNKRMLEKLCYSIKIIMQIFSRKLPCWYSKPLHFSFYVLVVTIE